jgi:iron complex transport system ATP-binding protein
MLTANKLSLTLGGNPVLQDVDLQLRPGEMVGLIGPNGAGKSSLLRVLAGLRKPDSGRVTLQLAEQSPHALQQIPANLRARHMAYLAQQETPAWPLTVEHLAGLGRAPWHKPMGGKTPADTRAIEHALTITELNEFRQRPVSTLSGGELQRALLARIFAGEPQLILADEPIAALDPYHQLHIMELLQDHACKGGAVLAALHDLSLAARYCHRLILLHNGRVMVDGEPIQVLTEESLERVYGISAYVDCREGGVVIIPRARSNRGGFA